MKKTLKKITSVVLVLFAGVCAFAEGSKDVRTLVDAKYADELIKNGVVSLIKDDGTNTLELLPKTEYSEKLKKTMIVKDAKNYPFTYQALYYVPKADLLKASNSTKDTITIDDVSRVCRSVSKMQGMMYYSSTKKKETVLYDRAYTIASETDKTPVPDKIQGSADGLECYCLQNDASFGEGRYKLSFSQSEDTLLATFKNLDVFGIGPFKAIYTGKMMINILVADCDDHILLFLCTDLDSVKFPGIKGQITDSMTSRMDAVYKWFYKQF